MSDPARSAAPGLAPVTLPASPWPIFLMASIAVFLISIDATVLYVAFPVLTRAFPGTNTEDLSWVLNAYTVVYAVLLVPAGRLADLYGRRRMFLTGLSLFLLASLGCGLSGGVSLLIVFRVLQAVGAALLMPASLAVVLGAFPPERRAIAVSLWGALSGLGAAVGPSVGSWLIGVGGWPWAFYINLPLGLISVWGAARLIQESRSPERAAPLDLIGVLLLIVGVGAVALGLVRSDQWGWLSPALYACLLGGLAVLGLFVVWARRTPYPAIDLTLFRNRTYRAVNLATFVFGTVFAMMFFSFFLFMTAIWKFPLGTAGLAAMPGPLLVIPVSVITGRIASRLGHRTLMVLGALVFAAGAVWFTFMPTLHPDYLGHWLPGTLLTGIGTGMVLPSLSAAAVSGLMPSRFGIGSAVNQAIRQIGTVMGVAITVALVGQAHDLEQFRILFRIEIALAVLTALLCLPIDTRPATLSRAASNVQNS
ncbi:MFS transporter (plasmid) [Deinococcus sp. KNUC1210]|uniref:MFS transporter n=1 Tax=Deinococcus sp. KNUC1210 TaxID=2917691 RepID=UPI001EF0BD90|nr:MFS transporter [Deinococcus sp. KNUC1210]ULH17073.1 MFS transporter [Deinococcus sp. KNUC1210]